MPAGIGYTGRGARLSGSATMHRAASVMRPGVRSVSAPRRPMSASVPPRTVGVSSGAAALRSGGRNLMGRMGNMSRRNKLMLGGAAALGLGATALGRNTGRALDPQRGRPTGVYQY
jgi:hypothetical protein